MKWARRITPIMIVLMLLSTGSLAAAGEPYAAEDTEASSGPLRIMSFNLRYAANDSQPWEKRRPVMKQLILNQQPHIIGTQEGLHRQIVDLESDLPGYDWIGVGREGGSLGEYMAIFYNKERLKPLEQSHFWLSDTPQIISSASWGNQIPRMVTWVRFQDLRSGKTFYMVNTHLDHQSENSRQKSAELIMDKLAAFDKDIPVVITGDFNTRPGSESHSIFTGSGLMDGHLSAKKRTNDHLGTFHNYKDPTGGGSDNRIDWILHSTGWNVLHSTIIDEHENGQYPSDHYPVMIEAILQKASKTTEDTVPKQPLTPPFTSPRWLRTRTSRGTTIMSRCLIRRTVPSIWKDIKSITTTILPGHSINPNPIAGRSRRISTVRTRPCAQVKPRSSGLRNSPAVMS